MHVTYSNHIYLYYLLLFFLPLLRSMAFRETEFGYAARIHHEITVLLPQPLEYLDRRQECNTCPASHTLSVIVYGAAIKVQTFFSFHLSLDESTFSSI